MKNLTSPILSYITHRSCVGGVGWVSALLILSALGLSTQAWAEAPQKQTFTLSDATRLSGVSREQIEQQGPLAVAEIVSHEGVKGEIVCNGGRPSCSLVVQGQSKRVPASFNAEGEVQWLTTSVVLFLSEPTEGDPDNLLIHRCPGTLNPLYRETRCFPFTVSPNRTRKGQHLIAVMLSWGGVQSLEGAQRGGPSPFPWFTLRYAYAIEEWIRYALRVDTIMVASIAQTGVDVRLLSHPLASLSLQADVVIAHFTYLPAVGFSSGISASFGGPSTPLTLGIDTFFLAILGLDDELFALRPHATLEPLVSESVAMILRGEFIIPLGDESNRQLPLIVHAGVGAQW